MNLSKKQQQDLKAFFTYYAEKLAQDEESVDDIRLAECFSLGSYQGWTDKDLYKAVRMFDNYEDLLELLAIDNEDLVDIFWTIRESELA